MFSVLSSYLFLVLLFYWLNLDDIFYLSNITKPNYKSNQQIQLQYTDTIFQSWCYFILPVVLLWLKRTIKGDNRRKYKRNKGKGTSSQNSGREEDFFFFSHHCRSPRSRSIDNFLIILLFSHYFTFVIPLYYPFYNNIIPLFLLLYISVPLKWDELNN